MIKRSKKQLEAWHFDRFKEAYERDRTDFPTGTVSHDPDGPGPDFLVIGDKEPVGIDHTQLFRSPGMRMQEELQRRVIESARLISDEQCGKPGLVSVSFDSKRPFRKHQVDTVAYGLARLVSAVLASRNELFTVRRVGEYREMLPPECAYVGVTPLPPEKQSLWSLVRSAWDFTCTPELVQAAIDVKNTACADYRRKATEVWLLLVVDGGKPSSLMSIDSSVAEHRFQSSFDRTFLLCRSESRLLELGQS